MPTAVTTDAQEQLDALDGEPTRGRPSTRARLLDAAAEVFGERGYERTTVQEVARRAGMTTGAIYANFRDKAQLLLHATDASTSRIVADAEEARGQGLGAAERLVRMGELLAKPEREVDRRLLAEVFAAARHDAALGARVRLGVAALEDLLVRLVRQAQRDGDVAPDVDVRAAARFCLSVSLGYQQLLLAAGPEEDPEAWRATLRRSLGGFR